MSQSDLLPMSLLAELTHRCPLKCPYCSNPLKLDRREDELGTSEWRRVLDEAAALGVLQVHFSGGEPMTRPDVADLIHHAADRGIYTNLITSGILLDRYRFKELKHSGLEHVQLSFQDIEPAEAERIGGMRGAHKRKLEVAEMLVAEGLPLTINFVVHSQNYSRVEGMIKLAAALGAERVEIAHAQYHGWALSNRAWLLPTKNQLEAVTCVVEKEREHFRDKLAIDYVTPDYHAIRPKACMGGWGRRFLNITPAGYVLPCHAAQSIPNLIAPSVRTASLGLIWHESQMFRRYRGTDWMPEPCRSCSLRETDWGGCRCQALALTGDATRTDPVCHRSDLRPAVDSILAQRSDEPVELVYRRMGS